LDDLAVQARDDPAAFARLCEEIAGPVLKRAHAFANKNQHFPPEEVTDLVQEFFRKMREERLLDKYDPSKAGFLTWIGMITHNQWINYSEKQTTRWKTQQRFLQPRYLAESEFYTTDTTDPEELHLEYEQLVLNCESCIPMCNYCPLADYC
jgi:DNA-directed RNA polymerase specialized sigma24 family protein